ADHPSLTQSRRQRDVNRVDVFGREQFFITAKRARCVIKRASTLAFGDEFLAAFRTATGDSHDDTIAAVANGFPILPSDVRRAENAPPKFFVRHKNRITAEARRRRDQQSCSRSVEPLTNHLEAS